MGWGYTIGWGYILNKGKGDIYGSGIWMGYAD